MAKTQSWVAHKTLVWAAGVAILAGVLALLIPVSVSHRGSDVGCGTALIRDLVPAENYSIDRSTEGWARVLGYESRSPASDAWRPYTACTDALTVRRWIGWGSIVLGVGIATVAFVRRPSASVPAPEPLVLQGSQAHPAGRHSVAPARQATSLQPVGGPPSGWYPDQLDPTRLRWFDGVRWTEATLQVPGHEPGPPPPQPTP
ncbi:DUF2510 domain-containing protein [Rhodococcus sp. NPDC004095]